MRELIVALVHLTTVTAPPRRQIVGHLVCKYFSLPISNSHIQYVHATINVKWYNPQTPLSSNPYIQSNPIQSNPLLYSTFQSNPIHLFYKPISTPSTLILPLKHHQHSPFLLLHLPKHPPILPHPQRPHKLQQRRGHHPRRQRQLRESHNPITALLAPRLVGLKRFKRCGCLGGRLRGEEGGG